MHRRFQYIRTDFALPILIGLGTLCGPLLQHVFAASPIVEGPHRFTPKLRYKGQDVSPEN